MSVETSAASSMVETSNLNVALGRVRPLCVQLVQKPTVDLVQGMAREMKTFDADIMQELVQFLVFPLRCTLVQCMTKMLPQQMLVETCQALDILLSKSKLHQPSLCMDLFSLLSDILFTVSPGHASQRTLSEEEKMSVVQTLCKLVSSAEEKFLRDLYCASSIPRLGSLVSHLIAIASEFKSSRPLRLATMDGLLVLMQKNTKYGKREACLLGSRFAGLLPGVSTAMLKVTMGDRKQGQQVTSKALSVWTEVACLALSDESLATEQSESHIWQDAAEAEERVRSLVVRRTEDWVKSVMPRVEFMVKEITSLKKHDHWKVRATLVHWAHRLLSHCAKSLQPCVPNLLEVLVLMMTDSYEQVSKTAKRTLETYRDKQDSLDDCRPLVELLKENLFTLVTSLPRKIRMEDEEEKLAAIGSLMGYITLLGKNMSSLLLSLPHVTRLARVLVQVLEMDCADQKILEESGMGARGATNLSMFVQRVTIMKPRKVFTHFQSEAVRDLLMATCRHLGSLGDLGILVECVLDLHRESGAHQLACVLIINHLVAGSGEAPDQEGGASPLGSSSSREDIIRMLLEEYLSQANMCLLDTNTAPVPSSSSLSSSAVSLYMMGESDPQTSVIYTRNRAIMLTCLYLEGVGAFAKVLRQEFQPLLMDVLYPLAEKVGSQISAVSSTAYIAMSDICEACGYTSLDELIQKNVDYLVNSISLRLRHFARHRRAPSVLSVMLQFCGANILPLVWDSVVEILDTLDENHADQAVVFLPVLHQLTVAVARWYPTQGAGPSAAEQSNGKPSSGTPDPTDVTQFLLKRHKQRLEAEAFDSEDVTDTATIEEEAAKMAQEKTMEKEDEEDDNVSAAKDPPLHVKAVKEVLLRAKHVLASADPRLTLLALDIVSQGCRDLADHENELLPIVHQLWPSFRQRFYDAEKMVVIKAVKTLHSLCRICGDFIRKRVEKEVLPSLQSFLVKQAAISHGAGTSYHYTVNYKLQLALLNAFGDMAHRMGLDGAGLEQMIHSCLPYLSQNQPSKLQEACRESVKEFSVCDCDLVWLAMSGLGLPSLPVSPSLRFNPITVFTRVGEKNAFTDNITALFELLYDTTTTTHQS